MKNLQKQIEAAYQAEITEENYYEFISLVKKCKNYNKILLQNLQKRYKPKKLKKELRRQYEKLSYHIENSPSSPSSSSPFASIKEKAENKNTFDGASQLEEEKSKIIGEIKKLSNSLVELETDKQRKEQAEKISKLELRLKKLNEMSALPNPEKIEVPNLAKLKQRKRNLQSYISRESKKLEKEEGGKNRTPTLEKIYKKLKSYEEELLQVELNIDFQLNEK